MSSKPSDLKYFSSGFVAFLVIFFLAFGIAAVLSFCMLKQEWSEKRRVGLHDATTGPSGDEVGEFVLDVGRFGDSFGVITCLVTFLGFAFIVRNAQIMQSQLQRQEDEMEKNRLQREDELGTAKSQLALSKDTVEREKQWIVDQKAIMENQVKESKKVGDQQLADAIAREIKEKEASRQIREEKAKERLSSMLGRLSDMSANVYSGIKWHNNIQSVGDAQVKIAVDNCCSIVRVNQANLALAHINTAMPEIIKHVSRVDANIETMIDLILTENMDARDRRIYFDVYIRPLVSDVYVQYLILCSSVSRVGATGERYKKYDKITTILAVNEIELNTGTFVGNLQFCIEGLLGKIRQDLEDNTGLVRMWNAGKKD